MSEKRRPPNLTEKQLLTAIRAILSSEAAAEEATLSSEATAASVGHVILHIVAAIPDIVAEVIAEGDLSDVILDIVADIGKEIVLHVIVDLVLDIMLRPVDPKVINTGEFGAVLRERVAHARVAAALATGANKGAKRPGIGSVAANSASEQRRRGGEVTVGEIVALVIFGAWFGLTVLVNLPPAWCKLPRNFEPTGHLLPGWHFSPKPIVADIELLFRYVPGGDPDGAPTEWMNVLPYSARPIMHMFFNPNRKVRKAIFQCGQRILLTLHTFPDKRHEISFTVPYLLLLDRVTGLCPNAAAVQFRIDVIRHGPFADLTGFRSPMHAVELAVDEDQLEVVETL